MYDLDTDGSPVGTLEAQALEAIVFAAGGPVFCGWFAGCDRWATTTVKHPVLDYVPCCASCAARATA